MNCPNCDDEVLQTRLTMQAIEVDCCPNCQGVWLERGGCQFFSRHPGRFAEKLAHAITQARTGTKLSPRNKSRMLQVYYDSQYELNYCQSSNGIWFDAAELKAISRHDVGFKLDLLDTSDESDEEDTPVAVNRLRRLSTHFISIVGSGTGYLGLLWFGIFSIIQLFPLSMSTSLWVASSASIILLLISPLLFDVIINKIFNVSWKSPGELNNKVNSFIDKLSQQHTIRYPKVGVISTDIPQAFCYGYTHNHARLVVTSGLMQQLDAKELSSVMGFLLGQVVNRDMAIISQTQLLPFVCRLLVNRVTAQQHKLSSLLAFLIIKVEVLLNLIQLPLLRQRVLHADRFIARYTNTNILMRSILKLNRACTMEYYIHDDAAETEKRTHQYISAIGCMGMLSCQQAIEVAAQSYRSDRVRDETEIRQAETPIEITGEIIHQTDDLESAYYRAVEETLLWQRVNPWSRWFEFFSSFPYLNTRFTYLANYAEVNGNTPLIYASETTNNTTGKNWDAFVLEFIIYISPYLAISIAPVYALAMYAGAQQFSIAAIIGVMSLMLGSILLLRLLAYYPFIRFPQVAISMLYRNLNVSTIHPIACEVNGMLLGQAVPGYLYSNNTYIKDSTGIIEIEHAAKLDLASEINNALKDKQFVGARVVVQGWYRHAPRPFLEIKTIKIADKKYQNFIPLIKRSLSAALCVFGVVLLFI